MADYSNPTDIVTVGTAGDDTFTVTDRGTTRTRTVSGSGGYDRLIVDRAFDTASSIIISQFSGTASVFGTINPAGPYDDGVLYFQEFESVRFTGTAGNDSASIKVDQAAAAVTINLDGGAGTDRLTLDLSAWTSALTFLASTPIITSSFGSYAGFEVFTVYGGAGNDEIRTGDGNDELRGGAGTNILSAGGGNDTIYTVSMTDWTDGGTGTDYWTGNYAAVASALTIDVGDVVKVNNAIVATNVEFVTVSGGTANDVITLRVAGAQIYGGAGTDLLVFTPSANQVQSVLLNGRTDGIWQGGINTSALNDIERVNITGGALDDDFRVLGAFTPDQLMLDGGAGNDLLTGQFDYFTTPTTFAVRADGTIDSNRGQFANFERFSIIGGSASDTISTGAGNDTISGGGGNDTLAGGGGNDQLFGGAGDDTIQGGDGDDTLDGGLGADILSGDAGNDRFVFSAVQTSLPAPTAIGSIDGGTGYDVLDLSNIGPVTLGTIEITPGTYGLGVYVGSQRFSITGVEKILLSSFSNLSINPPDNAGPLIEIRAGQGADSFQGAGNYAFYGEGGDDRFFISGRFGQPATNGVIDGGTGLNTLTTNISFTIDLGAGTASSGSASYVVANIQNVIVTSYGYSTTASGDDAANVFSVQSFGNDGVAGVNFFGRGGDDTLTGSAGADTLDGGTGNDILDGGAGADSMVGGLGNDRYSVDQQADLVFENANEGTDTVTSSGNFYLYENIENLTLAAGAGNIFGVGNDLANTILGNEGNNTLLGGGGVDSIRAGTGVDIVYGEAGNDQLFGDAGNDFLAGGIGDDTIDGGIGGDSLYGEDGNDTLTGGSDFVFDQLVGGAGDDVLGGDSGYGDYDYLYGNAGNDSFYVDTPADLVFEQANEGTDTVYASINGGGYYLYDNIENLVLLGNTPFGVGNALANRLTGNAQGNYLLGGGGNDILNGKGGNDVLFGESGADTFVFGHGTGGDVIGDFVAGTDRIDLSAFGFASFAAVQAATGQNGTDSFITLGNGDFIVLNGVAQSSLQAGDFILTAGQSANSPVSDSAAAGPLALFDLGDDSIDHQHFASPVSDQHDWLKARFTLDTLDFNPALNNGGPLFVHIEFGAA